VGINTFLTLGIASVAYKLFTHARILYRFSNWRELPTDKEAHRTKVVMFLIFASNIVFSALMISILLAVSAHFITGHILKISFKSFMYF
jgi:divalent metal cation (Fe/Co/Zn/Cd) transporter